MSDDVFTRDDNGDLAVRTVGSTGDNYVNKDDVYTRDDNGNLCVRVTGGGDQHNLGYYDTPEALRTAHPTANAGDFATVESTDTIWIWDSDTSAWKDSDQKGQVTSVNGQTGDVVINTFFAYPAGWTTNSTTKAFCDDIAADTKATVGNAYLGDVTFSDLPEGMVNAEVIVEIMAGTTAANKVIVLKMTSGTTSPYQWQYTYWNGGSNVSGWIGFQPKLVSGTNIKTINGESVLGSGNLNINAVPQYETMPEATASNVDEIAMYSGETQEGHEESATIEQTTGSTLSNLAVDLATFVGVEQPTGEETVEFEVTSVSAGSVAFTTVTGDVTVSGTYADWMDMWNTEFGFVVGTGFMVYRPLNSTWEFFDEDWTYKGECSVANNYLQIGTGSSLQDGDTVSFETTFPVATWEKDNESVNPAAYGITYNGTPNVGDVLTVTYLPEIENFVKGYFYKNNPIYSNATATVSQTAGSGLTELAVNVDTFVATEQPTQSETITFTFQETPELLSPTTFTLGDATITINQTTFLYNAKGSYSGDWANVAYVNLSFDGSSWSLYIYDSNMNMLSNSGGINLEIWGVSVEGTLPDSGLYTLEMTYSPAGGNWFKNGSQVDISTYGISYSGTPNDSDVLTVVYTAPTIIDYDWEQMDVQPGGQGGSSIEWTTSVDLPANSGLGWSAAPIYTVVGGLPNGEYEFYWRFAIQSNSNAARGRVAFYSRFKVNNDSNYAYGYVSPVIDGNWLPNDNYVLPRETFYMYACRKSGSDFVLWSAEQWWRTDIAAYLPDVGVQKCFECTKIKDINTGDEYNVVGRLYDENVGDVQYSGNWYFQNLVQSPYIAPHYVWNTFTADDTTYVGFGQSISTNNYVPEVANVTVSLASGDDCYQAIIYNRGHKLALVDVIKATGIFSNSLIGINAGNNSSYIQLNLPAGSSGVQIEGIIGYLGSLSGIQATGMTTGSVPSNFRALSTRNVGSVITIDNYGEIAQYNGTTNANYTNGYFYKATGTPTFMPESITVRNIVPNDCTVSIPSASDLVQAIATTYGWDASYIRDILTGSWWTVEYDADNSFINQVYWDKLGWMSAQSVLDCFAATVGSGYTGYVSINFNTDYLPDRTEIQNPAWQRIDTQPTTKVNTTITISVADWNGGTTVTKSIAGVTATGVVLVGAAPGYQTDYTTAGVQCTAQADGALTFTCTTTPSNDIDVVVVQL